MKQRNHILASITTQSAWGFGAALPSYARSRDPRPCGVMGGMLPVASAGIGARTA